MPVAYQKASHLFSVKPRKDNHPASCYTLFTIEKALRTASVRVIKITPI